ncbi:glycoside hydrolase family 31 protein [Mucisphaera calidilacus]|uniref:Alpha-xylosidase n=1 Tax=Mucisphaera calidilacus TaxID=2527982 RepID=A0A518BWX7_9BACT|nr:glycoside hydrolase family 31 protein [Mucisphaera calidilacus]QDU71478.1 Alpha-xylosidase [Mucisphaera calidilacus]
MSLSPVASESLRVEPLAGERWWGGRVVDGHHSPYGDGRVFSTDLRHTGGNQAMSLLLSSHGRVVWSSDPFAFSFDASGVMQTGPSEPRLPDMKPPVLVEAGSTLSDAYAYASRDVFQPDGRCPDARFFTAPQYNTWIELLYEPSQEKVLAYTSALREAGYPPGVLMIDDGWARDYGEWRFDHERFPDPDAMVSSLHSDGFAVMLWVCPFVSPQGIRFIDLKNGNKLLRQADGDAACRRWWNGYSALVDFSNPESVNWFLGQLEALRERHGIDGFKVDAGDTSHYRDDDQTYLPGTTPMDQTRLFVDASMRAGMVEVKGGFGVGGRGVAQRLRDRHHDWSEASGVGSLIPFTLAMSLTGLPFTCPDMIGGGEWLSFVDGNERLDPELFVRHAQIAACLPMMQFSAAPWRLLGEEHNRLCLEAAELHVALGPLILDLAERAARTSEPIVRPMEYHYPHQGLAGCTDQFMLGPDLLAAPVTRPRQSERTVQLPEGRWEDDLGQTHTGPMALTTPTPLDRVPRYRRLSR